MYGGGDPLPVPVQTTKIGIGQIIQFNLGVTPVVVPAETLGLLLLMRAFADGCSAITGVEAVSNGVPAFKPTGVAERPHDADGHGRPRRRHVPRHVVPGRRQRRRADAAARRSSRRSAARSSAPAPLYYVLQLSTMGILILAAQHELRRLPAARVDPRARRLHAQPVRVPRRAAGVQRRDRRARGRSRSSSLVAFGGRVEALIPLYAIGVFTSITLSQAGHGPPLAARSASDGWRRSVGHQRRRRRRDGDRDGHLRRREVRARRLADRRDHPAPRRRRCCSSTASTSGAGSRPRSGRTSSIGPPRRHQRVIVPVPDVTRDVVQAIKFGRTMSDDVDRGPCDRRPRRRRADSASGSSASSRACRS